MPKTAVLIATLSGCLLAACAGKKVTEIVVGVDSDLSIPAEMDELGLTVEYVAQQRTVIDLNWDLDRNKPGFIELPARIALLPGEDPSRVLGITVRGLRASQPVVQRRALLPFARDRILFLRLNLLRRCVSTTCPQGQTCGESGCEPEVKDPGSLPDYSREEEQKNTLDGGPPGDGAPVPDAPRDAPIPDAPREATGGDDRRDAPGSDAPNDGPPAPDALQNDKGTSDLPVSGNYCVAPNPVGFPLAITQKFLLTLDPQGAPSVLRVSTTDVQHRRFDGTQWNSEASFTPPSKSQVVDAAAAIDAQNRLHLVYLSSGSPAYPFHLWRSLPGGAWPVLPNAISNETGMQRVELAAIGTDLVAAALDPGTTSGGMIMRVGIKWNGATYSYTGQSTHSFLTPTGAVNLDLAAGPQLVATATATMGQYIVRRGAPLSTTVDLKTFPPNGMGMSPLAVAVDGSDVHLAYVADKSAIGPEITYLTWSGSTLSPSSTVIGGAPYYQIDLAVSPTGVPHVAYQEHSSALGSDTLYVMQQSGGNWVPKVTDARPSSNSGDLRARMAFDSNGNLHVVYVVRNAADTGNELKHVCIKP
jgi:hypothetical protein